MNNQLKYFIKEIMEEAIVDEPSSGPLGKVLFAPNRIDDVEQEENTEIENKLFSALAKHYLGSNDDLLRDQIPVILDLIKSNKYTKFLKAPDTNVYRCLRTTNIELLKKISGYTKEQLLSNTDRVQFIKTNKTIKPLTIDGIERSIQSWTTKIDFMAKKYFHDYIIRPEDILIILKTHTNNGVFFLNPELTDKIKDFKQYKEEYEVLSYGPVKLSGISCYLSTEYHKAGSSTIFQLLINSIKNK